MRKYSIEDCWAMGYTVDQAIQATEASRSTVEAVYAKEEAEWKRYCELRRQRERRLGQLSYGTL